MTPGRASARQLQSGYMLLPFLAVVGIAASSLVYVWAAPRDSAAARDQRTAAALSMARDALMGRAAAENNRPGSLPCPDVNNDGVVDSVAGNCIAYVGRLPWRTLGLPDLRDGWGERLWYALSAAYRDHPSAGPLNSDTPGAYTVRDAAGTVLSAGAPALLIAPGPPLGSQSREPGNQSLAAMYLDGENANADANYVAASASASFNDRLLVVGREELFRPVVARVAKEAQAALERYHAANQYYPPANPYDEGAPAYACNPAALRGRIPVSIVAGVPAAGCTAHEPWQEQFPTWFFANGWHLVTHYAVASACADTDPAASASCTANAGSEPLAIAGVSNAVRALVIVSGPARAGEPRPCASAAQCVDDAANGDGDTHYVRPASWPVGNDRMAATCAAADPCAVMP